MALSIQADVEYHVQIQVQRRWRVGASLINSFGPPMGWASCQDAGDEVQQRLILDEPLVMVEEAVQRDAIERPLDILIDEDVAVILVHLHLEVGQQRPDAPPWPTSRCRCTKMTA